MRFTPNKEAEIQTELSIEEVVKRLAEQIEVPTIWNRFLPVKRKAFIGSIVGHDFAVVRTLNSSRITGDVRPGEKGAIIRIKCKLGPILNGVIWGQIIGFSSFSVFVLLGALYTIVTKGITAMQFFSYSFLIPVLLPVLMYLGYVQNISRVLNSNVRYFNELFKLNK